MLIAGWYGNGNVGDEAILRGVLEAVRAADDRLDLRVLSASPRATERDTCVRALPRTLGFRGSQLPADLLAAVRVSTYALGGGGLLKDMGGKPGNCHRWLRPMRFAQRCGRVTLTYAIGVEAIQYASSARVVRETLSRCDLVTVRDGSSKRLLRDLGVPVPIVVTADPAVLLGHATKRDGSTPPTIAVCLREWPLDAPERPHEDQLRAFHGALARALDALVEQFDARILFVPFRRRPSDDDVRAASAVKEGMATAAVLTAGDVPDPLAAAEVLGRCDLVIAMRLHALILAAASETPVLGIGYLPKIRAFLEHSGLASAHVPPARISDIEAYVRDAYANRELARHKLATTMPLQRQLAMLNGQLLAAIARRHDDRVHALSAQAADTVLALERLNGAAPP